MKKVLYYFLILLFLIPACSRSKSLYDQKRSLMILDTTEQPINKKALNNSKKRQKKNKKRPKNKRHRSKSFKRR